MGYVILSRSNSLGYGVLVFRGMHVTSATIQGQPAIINKT